MAKVWCEYEGREFDDSLFTPYEGGPRLEHLNVEPQHTNDGLEVGHHAGRGPRPGAGFEDIAYGHGPMAEPPPEE